MEVTTKHTLLCSALPIVDHVVASACDKAACWHCVPSKIMKSSSLTTIIEMKWECIRRRHLIRLCTKIGKIKTCSYHVVPSSANNCFCIEVSLVPHLLVEANLEPRHESYLLVLSLPPNLHASRGSLDRHSAATLTWLQRLSICLAAARGLNYLHDPKETQQRVLHCDIKSSNILLDENWNAKVSDLGL
ncbi:hypothetical protein OSB04_002689 [Centaurea solstitialis]|uniref:Protein kinase domain-containing protein n=1 Tax=Centaurea solstitialis TaxID=347529 RepID=A0AA38UBM8_9ASTR|nr:hypothetical protein OSB04_002689 [Centaurea solstitialis]